MHTKTHTSKALALLLSLAIALLGFVPALAAGSAQDALSKALGYLDGKSASLAFGNTSNQSDWKAFALARGGKTVPETYLASAASALEAGPLASSTDYARAVLVLTAMGYDASDFAGRNLLEPLMDKASVTENLPNGPTFALLAMNSHSAYADEIPSGYDWELADILLEEYTALGWSAGSVDAVDIDATAMALQALAPYYSTAKVKAKADAALALLADEQFASGGFGSDWGEWGHYEDACSTAQVITALSVLGLDAASYFAKNTMDYLLSLQEADGSFDAAWGENPFADAQAAYALAAYTRHKAGGSSLFNLNDVALAVYPEKIAPSVPTKLEQWEAKLPSWLKFIIAWPDWIEWIIYYVFFGWIWDVIYK